MTTAWLKVHRERDEQRHNECPRIGEPKRDEYFIHSELCNEAVHGLLHGDLKPFADLLKSPDPHIPAIIRELIVEAIERPSQDRSGYFIKISKADGRATDPTKIRAMKRRDYEVIRFIAEGYNKSGNVDAEIKDAAEKFDLKEGTLKGIWKRANDDGRVETERSWLEVIDERKNRLDD